METGEKRKVAVNVGGKGYTLVSSDPAEHVQRVAALADRTLREIALSTRQSVQQSAVLAVISLADEVIKAQDENSRLRREIQGLRTEAAKDR
ncbi:MAG: cell division protein ZapA [Clostridia bacterium]|nr:cell division protein ZapA [Clostridia bacterium]MBR1685770.1 cell division protein ZapA [Clostridia bacterium]